MKKIILLAAFMLTFCASAQVNYPGKYVELLLNREVKVLPTYDTEYYGFYTKPDFTGVYQQGRYSSVKSSLVGRIFKVTDIKVDLKFSSLITLNDGKETLYYKYASNSAHDYFFEVIGGLELPLDYFCDQIKVALDDNEFKIYRNEIVGYGLKKTITKATKEIEYELAISTGSNSLEGKGVTLVLANGKKIERPRELVGKNAGKGLLQTFLELSKADIDLLTESEIATVTMNGHLLKVNRETAGNLRGQLKCLLTKE
jgi:hypothetical protein